MKRRNGSISIIGSFSRVWWWEWMLILFLQPAINPLTHRSPLLLKLPNSRVTPLALLPYVIHPEHSLCKYSSSWVQFDDFICHPQVSPPGPVGLDKKLNIHWRTFSHSLTNIWELRGNIFSLSGQSQSFDVGGAELEQVMDCTLRTILLCKCHSLRLNLCANYLQVVLEANHLGIRQFMTVEKWAKPCKDR